MITIKPDREYMHTILDKIKDGSVLIPEFQRDFVWTPGQILALWDSVLKGFPVGSLIFWKPEKERFRAIEEVEGVRVRNVSDDNSEACYVLDGRQRLTVMMSSLFEEGSNSNRFVISLDEMVPYRRQAPLKPRLNELSLLEAYDTYTLVNYLERLKASNLSDEEKRMYSEKAKSVNRILQSYQLGYIDVRGGSIDEAVEIFSRLNSRGTSISKDFMIQALAYNSDSNFLFGETITNIKSGLADYNFSDLSRDIVFRCTYNHTDKLFIDGRTEDILKRKQKLPEIMREVNEEITRAVKFLYEECGVIDSRLMPYSYHLIILADFFRIAKNPGAGQIRELKKWFFYTTYTSYFTNTSFSRIRKGLQRFRQFAKGEIDRPMEHYKNLTLSPFPEKYSLKSVRVCGLAAVLMLRQEANRMGNSVCETLTLPIEGLQNRNCSNTIFCNSKETVLDLSSLFKGIGLWHEEYGNLGISKEIVQAYKDKNVAEFIELREKKLISIEKDFLKSIGLEVAG